MTPAETIAADGACLVRGALSAAAVAAIANEFGSAGHAGSRGLAAGSATERLIASNGPLGRLAFGLSGRAMRPARIIRFDKTSTTNWLVPWHQDRTIAVVRRADVPGFGPWSVKAGVPHVEPPVELLEVMLTLRLFVDRCGVEQGPLKIALGSHKRGRTPAGEVAAIAAEHPVMLATGDAGDVLAMQPLAIHASERSRSEARRRVLHVEYAAADLPPPLEWAFGAHG